MALTARMVTMDCADPTSLAAFWTEAASYKIIADYDGWYIVMAPADGEGLRLSLQKVPEERITKNRVHVDWAADDRLAEVDRLTGLGAKVLGEHAVGGAAWTVLADPEGNEFCVTGRE